MSNSSSATIADLSEIKINEKVICSFKGNLKQQECLRALSTHRFVLYGGAMGGGKSYLLRWALFLYLVWLYDTFGLKNVTVALFCEDYPSLYDRQISKINFEFPPVIGRLRLGITRDFILPSYLGGGIIALRNLDDPSKYQSAEFAAIAVDELTKNTKEVFDFLRTRLRWPGVERPIFIGATNPGGKGHAWVKNLWVDDPPKFPAEMEPIRKEFKFIRARATDNPKLTQEYWDQLRTLPADQAKAFADGSWDLFKGQYFDNFNRPPHIHIGKRRGSEIVAGEKVYKIEPWWPKWISFDWGFKHEFAAYWHTTAPDGRHITYREWVDNRLTPRMLGEGFAERSVDSEGRQEKIQQFFLDPYCYADRTGESTIAELIRDVACRGDRLPLPAQASDDRVGGWQLLYQLLESDQWLIAENCERLIENLPVLIRDDKKPEDIKKVDGDDPADAARYGLYSRLGTVIAPVEVRREAAIQKAQNPTARGIMAARFDELERKRNQPMHLPRRRKY